METVHLLKNSANASHLAKSIEQYHSCKVENHETINDCLVAPTFGTVTLYQTLYLAGYRGGAIG